MRCYCCNKVLSDYESTRKSINTGNYLDMCNRCYGTISNEILAIERSDLRHDDTDDTEGYTEDEPYDAMQQGKLFDDEN
ncbi:hypothetical protein UFOVP507_20 [uncultured Caudovirales phage]|jgi:hypothetical protein|uniref:Uncharacterized protein n=1 Tax=uncultured Caudovirales phage TaxID=2100421 RepID=A0A6J5MMS9_9CAUD|nr:hypothetical protein UFOVP507_20 [uncultured Caudovirales phage]